MKSNFYNFQSQLFLLLDFDPGGICFNKSLSFFLKPSAGSTLQNAYTNLSRPKGEDDR